MIGNPAASDWEMSQLIRFVPDESLAAELEAARYLAIEIGRDHEYRPILESRIARTQNEIDRCQRVRETGMDDPLVPSPSFDKTKLKDRVAALKDRWPIDRFSIELMGCDLTPVRKNPGKGPAYRTRCPLPGHQDDTPSFAIYGDGHAWCFGCKRGGDIFELAKIYFGFERFMDALHRIEQER